jgi:hypothetical protein
VLFRKAIALSPKKISQGKVTINESQGLAPITVLNKETGNPHIISTE